MQQHILSKLLAIGLVVDVLDYNPPAKDIQVAK